MTNLKYIDYQGENNWEYECNNCDGTNIQTKLLIIIYYYIYYTNTG